FFFSKQKTAYEIFTWLEFRRVLFRSAEIDETRAELQRVRDALDTDDNEQAAQAAAQVQRDAAHFMAQIARLTEETRDRQFEESEIGRAACREVGWTRERGVGHRPAQK